ncbi:MAG: hypothetical protein KDK08_05740 [Rhizobiaceae bacterium]|nr:hypothetical protein [Rhizobiaceae bacterium]MCC0000962.1 hypothetical protein [Methylobacteriaceae bacterium]
MATNLAQGKNGRQAVGAAIDAAAAAAQLVPAYTKAQLPAAATMPNRIVFVSDAATGSGQLAYSNGTAWKSVTLGGVPA